MKVVFLQKDSFVKVAFLQLYPVLLTNGHECEIIIESGERDFEVKALAGGADLFAFSCTTGEEPWVQKTAEGLKRKTQTPIIVGGPHPTFYPEIIDDPNIDYICRGEGEGALVELLEALAHDPARIKEIENIWSKDSSGKVYETQVRPFIQDLDALPYPDFAVYAKYKYLIPYYRDQYPVMTNRGCPKNCTYCFNHSYKKLYRNKGRYLRKRSPEGVINELKRAKDLYRIRQINFVDDSFFTYPEWVEQFAALYKETIRLPFIINVESTHVTEDLVRVVKEMGCICIRMGVETGNEHLRVNVLNKKVSTQQIRNAAGDIKKYGIKLNTYNILGLPGETLGNAMETYRLNKEIGVDLASCSLLQPYPGTEINHYIMENGYFEDPLESSSFDASFFASSRIKLENKKEIVNLQNLMQFCIKMHLPLSMVLWLIKLPSNFLYRFIFKASFIYSKMRIQRIRVAPVVLLGIHSLSYMKSGRGR